MAAARKPANFQAYIAGFPTGVQAALRKVRAAIKATVPEAGETISYGIPAFTLNGTYLVYLAAYKKHFSLHPIPRGDAVLRREMAGYEAGAGTLRFRLGEPVPVALIKRVVRQLLRQNKARAAAKARRR